MTQSLAIIEYLEDVFPYPPFPQEPLQRAEVRSINKLLLAILSQSKIFV